MHLQLAGLTDGIYNTASWLRLVGKDASFPPFVLGTGSGIFPFSLEGNYSALPLSPSRFNGGNKWYIGANPSFVDNGTGWGLALPNGLTDATLSPADAYAIDSKIDEGSPTSGKVQAFWGVSRITQPSFAYGSSYAQNPSASSCASSASSYNLATSYSNEYLCQLILDAPF